MQLVLNLVLNAVDALDGGGRVRVTAAPSAAGGVQLVVEDNGPGVAIAVRDRLFEPFVTTKEVGKGTGLGLAVCRGLVEAVGGSIALDPDFSDGARFVVELPGSNDSARAPLEHRLSAGEFGVNIGHFGSFRGRARKNSCRIAPASCPLRDKGRKMPGSCDLASTSGRRER